MGVEVQYTDVVKSGIEVSPAEGLVRRMGQIRVPARLVIEAHDEAMGVAVIQVLGAGVATPLEAANEW